MTLDQRFIVAGIFAVMTCIGVVGTDTWPTKALLLGLALAQTGILTFAVLKKLHGRP